MKPSLFAILALTATTLHAQSPEGWMSDALTWDIPAVEAPLTMSSGPVLAPKAPVAASAALSAGATTNGTIAQPTAPPAKPLHPLATPAGFGGTSSAPDEVTPEIAALTQGVINGPGSDPAWLKCFYFVSNQIEYEHYYGCKKGALLTFLERKGSDADLATLLVAMLRSAGYTARYGYGMVAFSTANDANDIYIQDWLGCSADTTIMSNYSSQRGWPSLYVNGTLSALHRVWVEVNVAGTWKQLDAAVKKRIRIAPSVDVASASGYARAALESAAGGTISANAVELMNESAIGTYLTARTTALLAFLDTNHHGTDAENLLGGWRQTPFLGASGGQFLFFGFIQTNSNLPFWDAPQQFTTLPASLLSTIKLELRSTASGTPLVATTAVIPMANLQGRRLSLTFSTTDATGRAQIWLDDTLLVEETSSAVGTQVNLKTIIDHPHSNSLGATLHDLTNERSYERGAHYALVYSFNPTAELLKARQELLDAYRRSGLADNARQVVTETLNIIGLSWMHQTELISRALGGKLNCDPLYHHRVGRVAQSSGYYIDVDNQFEGFFSLDGTATSQQLANKAIVQFSSAMEHGVLEQLQGATNPAVSTVKLLRLGNQQLSCSRKTFYANSTATWSTVSAQLQSYSASDLAKLQSIITQGGEVLTPQKGNIVLNSWVGAGYATRLITSAVNLSGMYISGNLNGGFASTFPIVVNVPYVSSYTNANPTRINTAPISQPLTLTDEPIDLSTGDYVFPTTDLEVGSPVPRGLTFTRQYHGGRRWTNPTSLGYGWTHNWQVRATRRSAYEPALGLNGTPYDVASAMVAPHAVLDIAATTTDAKHWLLTSFCANWFTDQLQDNAVSISVGERSLQFIRRADGIWQAPGGVKMTLIANGGGWQAQERHGNTYNFDSTGRLTTIVDIFGKTLTVAYNASNKVSTVTDAYARSLTFNYAGAQLLSVTDSTGRSVSFNYNSGDPFGDGDLVSATDPVGKIDRFTYDSEHRMTEVRNHDNAFVATNTYDSTGKLVEQNS